MQCFCDSDCLGLEYLTTNDDKCTKNWPLCLLDFVFSLCDKQRQLKRAKLIDTLSNQLQARPGPLELVAKNILHDDCMEQALKDGKTEHTLLIDCKALLR